MRCVDCNYYWMVLWYAKMNIVFIFIFVGFVFKWGVDYNLFSPFTSWIKTHSVWTQNGCCCCMYFLFLLISSRCSLLMWSKKSLHEIRFTSWWRKVKHCASFTVILKYNNNIKGENKLYKKKKKTLLLWQKTIKIQFFVPVIADSSSKPHIYMRFPVLKNVSLH